MKFGLKLHHSGQGASPEHMKQWAQFAENLGLHLVMVADHAALTPEVIEQYPAPYSETFTNLAWLAAHTEKVLLGTTVVVVPYRHPVHLAQMTSNVDQLSGGRLVFGVGIGWAQTEFDVFNVPFHKRGVITNDYLAAIKTLWTGEVASHNGPYVSFKDVLLSPKPVQSPHPPVWVGGSSDRAMRRAVRFGQAWHPISMRVDWLRDTAMPRLRQIAATEDLPVPALCPRIYCRLTDSPVPEDERMAGEGTLEQVHGDLKELEALGADYVLLDTKRNNPTADSPRHHDEAWRTVATLVEQAIDLPNETVR